VRPRRAAMPFPVPRASEVREAVSRSYWDALERRVNSPAYRRTFETFMAAVTAREGDES